MKRIWCLLLLAIAMRMEGQLQPVDHFYIDKALRTYQDGEAARLLTQITTPYQTDKEKVTAIFRWITSNISYNVRAWNRRNEAAANEATDDTARVLKPLNLRVAETVLDRRVAVCDGYARLFKVLCDYANIPSEIIYGYARPNGMRSRKFSSNHTWNAVYLDSAWHLLDATWSSGYTNYRGDEFIQSFDHRYFLAPPAQFIYDHYPEDVAWTLMDDPPSQAEFNQTPFRYMGFVKTGIDSYSPSKGVIEANLGDSIRFQVKAATVYGILEVSSTPPVDTIWFDDEPVVIGGREKSCTYVVDDAAAQWLYVTCNGRVILRYKLVIRRPENKIASVSGS